MRHWWCLDLLSRMQSINSSTHLMFFFDFQSPILYFILVTDQLVVCRFMPFLILSGQLCPPGIEGTLFALFMSINNLGSTIGSFVGAGLASFLNISSGSFDNLSLGIGIQVFCTFFPVFFLFLIPEEATGISASQTQIHTQIQTQTPVMTVLTVWINQGNLELHFKYNFGLDLLTKKILYTKNLLPIFRFKFIYRFLK